MRREDENSMKRQKKWLGIQKDMKSLRLKKEHTDDRNKWRVGLRIRVANPSSTGATNSNRKDINTLKYKIFAQVVYLLSSTFAKSYYISSNQASPEGLIFW